MKKLLLACFTAVLTLAYGAVLAQERTVSGKVTATEDGTALPGVNVLLKGTTTGTATDSDGNFSLMVPADGGSLLFSFIGLQSQEIVIGDRTVVNISLALDATQLSEVVVVGYGVQERRKMTTAVGSVKGESISQLASPGFAEQLGGRAAGVQVTVGSGILGTTPNILIRGTNSLRSGTFPLVVVDGIPMTTGNQSGVTPTNPLNDINPADIETYDILKDGAATAIYGSRGANGVILVTTKRGTKDKGKTRVDFTATTGYSEPVKTFDLANAAQFEEIANLKLANAGQAASAKSDPAMPGSGQTDWQDVILRKGAFSNYNLNIGGATESTNYYFSAGYQYQESNVVNNDFERFSFRTNADHRVNKWFKVGTGINFTRSETNGLNTGANGLSGNLAGGLRAFPNVTVYNSLHPTGYNITADNQALGQGANTRAITSSWTNQQFVLDKNQFQAKTNHILANIYAQIDIIDGLSLKTYYGADYVSTKDFQMWDPRHGDGRGSLGVVFNQQRDVILWNWQNTLNFNRDFDAHSIDFVAGIEYQKTTTESFNGQGTNFSDLFFMQHGLIGNTYVNQFSGGTFLESGFESYFGRLNYSFKDKYLFGVSLRYDGISKFAEDNRFGTFPGFSAGYRLSEEDFYKNSGIAKIMNEVKIRGSYAEVGNVDVPGGSFPYSSLYGSARYGSQNGVGFTQAGDPALTWETSKKTDIGADLGFMSNKIRVMVDYFSNDINDNVLTVPYAPSLGIPERQIAQNIGKLKSSGFEFTVNATALNKGGLTWDISANFTTVKNEVVATFLNSAGAYADIGRGSYSIEARVGEPMNVILGYEWAGVNPANGFPMFVKGDGTIIQRNVAVASTYYVYNPANPADISTTATLSSLPDWEGGDRKILGTTLPKWYGGLTNTLGYKGISLEIFLRFSGGNKVYNQTRQDFLLNQDFTNSGTELLNSWTPENTITDVPKMFIGNGVQINQTGEAVSRFVEDGDFLRIQNIALSYQLPTTIMDKIAESKIKKVRVYAQVQNAFTITGYNGLDPELGVGFDNITNPLNRTYTIGINIGL